MGTGVTKGPFSLSNNTSLTLNDPATYSVASDMIQIQNSTGFNLYIQSAGAGYNVQAFTASTIPTNYGQGITILPTVGANVTTGNLYVVWLLPGQDAPIKDGPLTIYAKSSHALPYSSSSGIWLIGGAGNYFGTDNSITVIYQQVSNPSPWFYAWLQKNIGGTTFGPVPGPAQGFSGQVTFSFPNGIPDDGFYLGQGTLSAIGTLVGPPNVVVTAAYASN